MKKEFISVSVKNFKIYMGAAMTSLGDDTCMDENPGWVPSVGHALNFLDL